jgi:hypothetical protein
MDVGIDLTGVATDLTTFEAALKQMHNYLTNLSQGNVASETCLATLHELRLNINELQETVSCELHTQQVAQEFTDKAIQDHMSALTALLEVPEDAELQVNVIERAA